jgi:hypothetical protein
LSIIKDRTAPDGPQETCRHRLLTRSAASASLMVSRGFAPYRSPAASPRSSPPTSPATAASWARTRQGQLRTEISLVRIHLAPPGSPRKSTRFPSPQNSTTFPRLAAAVARAHRARFRTALGVRTSTLEPVRMGWISSSPEDKRAMVDGSLRLRGRLESERRYLTR